jgi:hypothetical protein
MSELGGGGSGQTHSSKDAKLQSEYNFSAVKKKEIESSSFGV